MENNTNYPINDQIPSNQSLKNKVLAQMKARSDNYLSNRPSLSQYIQDAEEKQRMNTAKQIAIEESQKPFNRIAGSKVAANAMKNIVEPGIDAAMLIEGGGLAKNAIKSGLKSMSKKAIADEVASTITSGGTTRYFDKAGKELPYTNTIRSLQEVRNYNQGLKSQFKTGATKAPPEGLNPYLTDDNSKKIGLSTLEENKKFLNNEKEENINNLPKMLDAQNVINDFRERIKTPEGKTRMKDLLGSRYKSVKKNIKDLELKRDAQHVAYYQGGNQFFSTNPKIALNASKLDADIIRGVTRHELEHAVQHGYETEIDDMLSNLKLKNDFDTKVDLKKIDFGQKEYMSNNTKAKNYFEQGSRGQEKSAFLSELQQYLVDKKLISHPYAVNEITPKLIESIKTKGVKDYPLRILNIIEPEKNNYQIIANALNKMLIGTGAVAGANKLNSMKNNEK
jgi:hypothetical protein